VEGDNVAILYRWGENKVDRSPELAAELVRRRVAAIIGSGGLPAVMAARAATATIPVVFIVSEDLCGSAWSRVSRGQRVI